MTADKPTGRTFNIATVSDFNKVPAERRKACLHEFIVWLGMMDFADALLDKHPHTKPSSFIWKDDGEQSAELILRTQDQEISVIKGKIK